MSSAVSKTIMSHMGTMRRLLGELTLTTHQKEIFESLIRRVELTAFMADVQKEEKRCGKDLTCLLSEAMTAIAGVVTEVFSEGDASQEYQAPPPVQLQTEFTPYQGQEPFIPQVEQIPAPPPTVVSKKRKKVVKKRKVEEKLSPTSLQEGSGSGSGSTPDTVMVNKMAEELEKYMSGVDSILNVV